MADGGMTVSYKTHVAPALGKLKKGKQKLDIVYVSHIDDDHIGGVLQMMNDKVAWRVHNFQLKNGNPRHAPPKVDEPPDADQIWHNAFHELIKDNIGEVESMLAASAAILSGAPDPEGQEIASASRNLVTSKKQAIQLSRRVGSGQLNIPLNPQFDGKLMMVRTGAPLVTLGSAKISIIGPFPADVKNLRDEWNDWLRENKKVLKEISQQAARDEKSLGQSELDRFLQPVLAQAQVFGDRKSVTPPNLASLMLLVEEKKKTLLLTGDGHADDIMKGLDHHGKLNSRGRARVDVLKLQHHGSEHNITEEFCEKVTADQYVVCGNGFSGNPELSVLELIVNTRKRTDKDSFKFWFNAASAVVNKEPNHGHMQEVEKLMKRLQRSLGGRMQVFFNDKSSFQVPI